MIRAAYADTFDLDDVVIVRSIARSRNYNPAPGRQVLTAEGARRYGLPIGATIPPGMRALTAAQQATVADMPREDRAKYLAARRDGATHGVAMKAARGSAPAKAAKKAAPAKAVAKKAPAAKAPAKKAAPRAPRDFDQAAKGDAALAATRMRLYEENDDGDRVLGSFEGAGEDAQSAVERYASFSGGEGGFDEVNEYLRTGKKVRAKKHVALIDRALADPNAKLDRDVVVYRGVDGRRVFGDLSGDMIGREGEDKGFVSTSVDEVTASEFADSDGSEAPVVLRLVAPKGTSAIQLSPQDGEGELLLPRGAKFRVVADRGEQTHKSRSPYHPDTTARHLDVEVEWPTPSAPRVSAGVKKAAPFADLQPAKRKRLVEMLATVDRGDYPGRGLRDGEDLDALKSRGLIEEHADSPHGWRLTDRGRAVLGDLNVPSTTAPASSSDVPDLTGLTTRLKGAKTRQEAHAALDGLSGNELKQVAKATGTNLTLATTKDAIKTRIVEHVAGTRLDFARLAGGGSPMTSLAPDLFGLTTRQKRSRLKSLGFTQEQIDELAPTAAQARAPRAPRAAPSLMSQMSPEDRRIARQFGLPEDHPLHATINRLNDATSDEAMMDLLRDVHDDDIKQIARETGVKFPPGMSADERKRHLGRSLLVYGSGGFALGRSELFDEDDLERRRPYPGQKWKHGWIPVAGGLPGEMEPTKARAPRWDPEGWKKLHRPAGAGRIRPSQPDAPSAPEAQTMADHVKHWHADLSDLDDLIDSAADGAKARRREDRGPAVKAARVDFPDGTEGVITHYETEEQADGDQLVSALARAISIPAPRVLRVDDDRSVADVVEGGAWDGDLATPAAQRLGVLDLLAGIDTRDPHSVRLGPDGVVPVASAGGFRNVAITDTAPDKGDTRARRLRRIADVLDAAGPEGLSRAYITARAGNMPASVRDELLAELLATGDYVQVPNRPRGPGRTLGLNARFISLRKARGDLPTVTGRAAAEPPGEPDGLAFWSAFASGEWVDNPLTADDTRWLRGQLAEVRPQFAHLGRQHWWQFASDRLDALSVHATGDSNLFAPRALSDLSVPELVALLQANGLPTTGSIDALLRRLYAAGITA